VPFRSPKPVRAEPLAYSRSCDLRRDYACAILMQGFLFKFFLSCAQAKEPGKHSSAEEIPRLSIARESKKERLKKSPAAHLGFSGTLSIRDDFKRIAKTYEKTCRLLARLLKTLRKHLE
jgi:hypothetical protein